MSMPPAVILGGDANAVSVARSLGRRGVPVHALGGGGWDPVCRSGYCVSYSPFARDESLQESWLEWLDRSALPLTGAVLLPCCDDGLELIARRRQTLAELGYRPFEADDRAVLDMLDKHRTHEVAVEGGIPTPRAYLISDEQALDAAARVVGFPCGLKPRFSHALGRHPGWSKVIVVREAAELRRCRTALARLGVEVMLTEIIPGADDAMPSYYSYLDEAGQPLFHFTKRQLRNSPPGFGLTCYQKTEWLPDVAELGLRFFRAAGVRGLANVQFKRDSRDGRLKLIECNHRFTAANELAQLAGFDLAMLAYKRALGYQGPGMPRSFPDGLRMWDPVEDVRALLALRARGELTAGAWLRSLAHRQRLPLLRWDDPGPALIHLARIRRAVASRRVWRAPTAAPRPAPLREAV